MQGLPGLPTPYNEGGAGGGGDDDMYIPNEGINTIVFFVFYFYLFIFFFAFLFCVFFVFGFFLNKK